ncbi:MAG: tail fiber domain-containing protein [Dyadobacter sp.]|uniref:tail fiber domain-containing protein n=1 Tax=Dyadobacter sp. TaxID=1914288 RepID=UPI001B25A589|nr:tail fiber domain-containing protein [Dyadobacter sp.]MBO9615479.1 tail fiber domain-containing protein [Dyadobacter sp.]
MKKLNEAGRIVLSAVALSLAAYNANAQVGIGTTLPQARLHVHDGSVLATSKSMDPQNHPLYDPSNPTPIEYMVKWFYDKSAFRVVSQAVGGGILDPLTTGNFSFASGFEVSAQGIAGTALGIKTSASGRASLATGYFSAASGLQSFAHGTFCTANGDRSVAMGYQVSTNQKSSSFIFGDGSGVSQNDADNQMMMRFAGGYKLYSSANAGTGVFLSPNGNAWSMVSDVNKKENFAPVNGEDFLQKISKMSLTSWNYKGQDPKQYRHYGPMAQDFYKAFGQDAYGTIGSDTTINQADFDGVNLIAVQALIRRMEEMSAEIATIKTELAAARSEQGRKKKRILAVRK